MYMHTYVTQLVGNMHEITIVITHEKFNCIFFNYMHGEKLRLYASAIAKKKNE